MVATVGGQLALHIVTDDEATLENFQRRSTAIQALDALCTLAQSQAGECYLWGPASVGKSHLLQAVCHQMGNDALYLPLDELVDIPPEALLEGAETVPLLALDNIQAVLPHPDWQAQLFHVFNRRRDAGHGQLFSADRAPSELTTLLPDLRSRLTSVTIFQLPKQSEQELADMLQFRAARRGLLLSDEVVHYILARAERSAVALIELLVRLDKAALASARAVTIPLINELKLLSQDQ